MNVALDAPFGGCLVGPARQEIHQPSALGLDLGGVAVAIQGELQFAADKEQAARVDIVFQLHGVGLNRKNDQERGDGERTQGGQRTQGGHCCCRTVETADDHSPAVSTADMAITWRLGISGGGRRGASPAPPGWGSLEKRGGGGG